MKPRTWLFIPFFLLLAIRSVTAQTTDDERIRRLEERLERLARETEELRTQIAQLRSERPRPAEEAADLTKIDIAPAAPPALTEVTPVENAPSPASSKVFNPDISVIGNFSGRAGARNSYEFFPERGRDPLGFEEAEVGLQAFVDPYAKANFFLAAGSDGLSVEEAYAQFITLPHDLTARAGRFKAAFGKANTWHTHARPWVDQPLVIHNFFGDEQLADDGVEISRVFPNRFAYVEGTAAVLSGNADRVFERRRESDLLYDAHLKAFKDLGENSNLEFGASYARGGAAYAEGANAFAGIDVTWRWKPLQRGSYRSAIARLEAIRNDSPWKFRRNPRGFYASLDYQLAQRWFAGVRLDRADETGLYNEFTASPGLPQTDRGLSAIVTFWPSEFSQLRGQLRRTSYGSARPLHELLFQLQFSIGAHGAHTF